MLKKIGKFIQKFIVSAFILYSYNLIASPIAMMVPINWITMLFMTFFGIPALFGFIIILLLVY